MAELGTAYLSLMVSTSDMKRSVQEALGTVDGSQTKKAGGRLGKALMLGAKATVAGAAAGIGVALVKGFGRLQAIETARAKLKGLGHDTTAVEGIMKNALASVKGTSFGLDAAATTAAGAVAAGIKPGEALEKVLKSVANSAAASGSEMGEMGAIYNKVASAGKAQNDTLSQVAERGIPIYSALAKQLGVTSGEVFEMASKGKIDFAMFEEAMTSASGTVAAELGKTLPGSLKNAMAAVGRFGANLMSKVYPQVTGLVQGFIAWMGPMEDAAKIAGDAIGVFLENSIKGVKGLTDLLVKGEFTTAFREAFGVEEDSKLVDVLLRIRDAASDLRSLFVDRLIPALQDLGAWIVRNREWLEPLTVAVAVGAFTWKLYNIAMGGYTALAKLVIDLTKGQTAAQLALNKAWKAHPVGLIISVIVALVAAFVYLWNTNEGFRNFFIGAWEKIKSVIGAVGGFIGGIFQGISDWISGTLGPIFTWLRDSIIKPVFDTIGGIISATGDKVGGVFSSIVGFVRDTLGAAFTWLRDSVIKPVWAGIQSAIGATWGFLQPVFQAIGDFVKGVLGPVFTWLYETVIKPIWGLIKWQIDFVSNVLLFIFDLIVFTVKNILAPAFVWLYENVIKPMWSNIQSFIGTAWGIIKAVFAVMVNVVKTVLGAVFIWLWEGIIKPTWAKIQSFISTSWAAIRAVFTILVGFVRATLGAVFTWLFEYIIKPVWNGIKWYISNTWAGMKIIFNTIRDFVRTVLGPIFTWFYNKLIKPVWDGIKNTISTVWHKGIKPVFKALGDFITDTVAPAFKRGVDIIAEAWEGIKKAAGTPVFFVMETIYNQGIKKAFDTVAEKIGSDARLPRMNTDNIPHFAKGGLAKKGWAVVGEEGPELVNFTNPGRVYTAADTQAMLAGREQAPVDSLSALSGANPSDAKLPNGGFWSDPWGGLSGAAKKALDSTIKWVRGGLAKAAEALLNPLRNTMTSGLGSDGFAGLYSKTMSNAIDSVVGWVRGKDEEFPAEDSGGGAPGSYDGARGRFYRPSAGPYTSMFGPRWGSFHAGVDIAGGGPTYAALNGLVKYIGTGGGLPGRTGYGIRLDHGGGFQTYYGHNPYNGVKVKQGQQVKAGQRIGTQGATGNVTGTHLHFETLQNGRAINPMKYLHDSGGWHAPGTMSYNGLKKPEAILTPTQWDAARQAMEHAVSTRSGGDVFNMQLPKSAEVEDFTAAIRFEKRRKDRGGKW